MIDFLIGVAVAIAFLLLVRLAAPEHALALYAVALIVAALVYVAFALLGNAPTKWIVFELLGLVIYGAAAWLGLRKARALLAIAWAAHALWDMLLHLQGAGALYTPDWYPWICAGFDIAVGAAILLPIARQRATRFTAASSGR